MPVCISLLPLQTRIPRSTSITVINWFPWSGLQPKRWSRISGARRVTYTRTPYFAGKFSARRNYPMKTSPTQTFSIGWKYMTSNGNRQREVRPQWKTYCGHVGEFPPRTDQPSVKSVLRSARYLSIRMSRTRSRQRPATSESIAIEATRNANTPKIDTSEGGTRTLMAGKIATETVAMVPGVGERRVAVTRNAKKERIATADPSLTSRVAVGSNRYRIITTTRLYTARHSAHNPRRCIFTYAWATIRHPRIRI